MPAEKHSARRDGLSLQTLILAAVASGTAAIVTSHFWKGGTVIASAMTPVIVAIVKEGLARPMESELVRRPARKATEIAAARLTPSAAPVREPVGARARNLPQQPPPGLRLDDEGLTADGLTPGDVLLSHPRRTYGTSSRTRQRARLKLAIVTGLLAFVVAAVVLTVPELVFGGAVASHHSTTFFGGGGGGHSSSSSQKSSDTKKSNSSGQQSGSKSSQGQQPSNGSGQTSTTTTPQQTPSQPQSTQQPPAQQSPAPAAPSSPPPSGGGSAAPPSSP